MSEHKRMKILDLKPHPKNEEIYGKNEKISDLVEKIKRSGQVHTLVVTSKGIVLAGHRRLRACKELGIEEVEVEIVDFDTPEQEVEYLIDNNATREKSNEQKAREAVVLKQTLSVLAEKRKKSKLKQNRSINSSSASRTQQEPTDVPNLAPRNDLPTDTPNLAGREEDNSATGETREIIAKKVGLKSGHEADRAIKTIEKVEELKKEGRTEDAELVVDVMNNRGISAANSLAKNIDNIRLSEEEKEEVKSGRKSPNAFIRRYEDKREQKPEEKLAESSDRLKNLEDTLSEIQKKYHDYLLGFQEDVKWLSDKMFYHDDEDVSGKTHSELQNCLEKFKSISNVMENMIIDEFGCITIIKYQ